MNLSDLAEGPTLITVPETVEILGGRIGRSALYEAISRGEFPPARRLGRKIVISTPALLTWLGADSPADAPEGEIDEILDPAPPTKGHAPVIDRGVTHEIRSAGGGTRDDSS